MSVRLWGAVLGMLGLSLGACMSPQEEGAIPAGNAALAAAILSRPQPVTQTYYDPSRYMVGQPPAVDVNKGVMTTNGNISPDMAQNCQLFGNSAYCSDGLSAQKYGNQTYFSDGTSASTFGNQTYYSDGTSASRFGSQTYFSDGTTASSFGNQTYFSNGHTCQKYGNQLYCN
jgi:hypothetical protein